MHHIPRIYITTQLKENSSYILEDTQFHHLVNVLRRKENDSLVLFNGQGGEFKCIIKKINKKNVEVYTQQFDAINRTNSTKLHLALAVLKLDTMDFCVKKATELGVHTVTPVICKYSQIQKANILEKKHFRWQSCIQQAAEQCGINILPKLNPAINFKNFIAQTTTPIIAFTTEAKNSVSKNLNFPHNCSVMIGPEGGFSKEELSSLQNNSNVQTYNLGQRTLKAETACIVAINTLWKI